MQRPMFRPQKETPLTYQVLFLQFLSPSRDLSCNLFSATQDYFLNKPQEQILYIPVYPVYLNFLRLCSLCILRTNSGQTWWPDKEGRDVKKSTTVLDVMDYWRLLRPAGRGIILVSLLNWMRVSRTGATGVKVIGLTSEYHACNPLAWYLSAGLCTTVYLSCLYLLSRDDKLPAFHWSRALWQRLLWHQPGVASRDTNDCDRQAQELGTWVAAFPFITISCWKTHTSMVICIAKRNKWSMFFKAVERGPHCSSEIGKCSTSSE